MELGLIVTSVFVCALPIALVVACVQAAIMALEEILDTKII